MGVIKGERACFIISRWIIILNVNFSLAKGFDDQSVSLESHDHIS